jgi:hypothetical protein
MFDAFFPSEKGKGIGALGHIVEIALLHSGTVKCNSYVKVMIVIWVSTSAWIFI